MAGDELVPTPWSEIAGGRAALDAAAEKVRTKVEELQARFTAALDALGPPGMAGWDPFAGTLELRGHTFQAEQLGSFDGTSWLWSWANTYLNIPQEKTTLARALRDAADELGVPGLRTPFIADTDEELPFLLGGLAIAHGFGEAMYYANQSQIYLLRPGQLRQVAPKPQRFATFFSHARRSLADVLAHLSQDPELAKLPFQQVDDDVACVEGAGYALTLRRHDRLRDVLAHIKALPVGQDLARGAATVFTLEGTLQPSYSETVFTSVFGAWAPASELSGTKRIPWQVLSICKQLNLLDRMAVFDAQLGTFYPDN
jgi:hypothetical protein